MADQDQIFEAIKLHQAGHFLEAAQKYDQLLLLNPEDSGLWNLRGVLAGQTGYLTESVQMIYQAIMLNRLVPDYYRNLAESLRQLGNTTQEAETYNELGNVFQSHKQFDAALEAYDKVLMLDAANGSAMNNRVAALTSLGRYEEAVPWGERAISHLAGHRDLPGAHMNLGIVYLGLNQKDKALEAFDAALALQPDFAAAHWNRALILLLKGRLQEGFQEYEWRWQVQGYNELPRQPADLMSQGQPPKTLKKPLLVFTEQGFGDAIHFARYVPLLAEQYDIQFEVKAELFRLFTEGLLHPRIQVVLRPDAAHLIPLQQPFIGIMSLPAYFKTTTETIPWQSSYLSVPADLRVKWQKKIQGKFNRLKVGLVWAGSPTNQRDFLRSIPFEKLAPLLQDQTITFYALQKDVEVRGAPENFVQLGSALGDFSDTAAVLENLDLLISVDTATAHLAGALNRPVWILVTKVPDWRWGEEGELTPWYPSARIFRQPQMNDWDSVIAKISAELGKLSTKLQQALDGGV